MKCPGQDSRYWDGSAIFDVKCPKCGNEDEFFRDEASRKCKKCGYRIVNPKMDFGCASYCKFADQCVGDLPAEVLAGRKEMFKDRVAVQMKAYFGKDVKRIRHAEKVAEYSLKIAEALGADMAVVTAAGYLHDIGIRDAELKYNSNSAKYQEELGPAIAAEILGKLGAEKALIDEVCSIIGHHHHPAETETANFKALYDADMMVNIEEEWDNTIDAERLGVIIEKRFLSEPGKKLAMEELMKNINQLN